ncbi:MAG: peptidylprolyl isomerase [Thermoguttaceae bacterium]
MEDRWVLSPAITGLPAAPVQFGLGQSSLYPLAVTGSSSTGVTYSVTSTDTVTGADDSSVINAGIVPQTDQSLKIAVSHGTVGTAGYFTGTMTFQLFDDSTATAQTTAQAIETLVTSGAYNNKTFYRIAHNPDGSVFAIQGGTQASASNNAQIDSGLQFNTAGILAIANKGSATSDSQDFFITTEATPWLTGGYTVFGMLTGGASVLQEIAGVACGTSSDTPLSPVTITSASLFTDPVNGVLLVKLDSAATGSANITVTATDTQTQAQIAQSTFKVTANQPPVLATVPDITGATAMSANTGLASYKGYTFNLTSYASDPDTSDTLHYGAIADVASGTEDITVTADSTTGAVTIVPKVGVAGTRVVLVGVNDGYNNWVTQDIEVTINPLAPASITFTAPAGQTGGFTKLHNSSTSEALSFHVTGVVAGFTVNLYADGSATPIGSATVPDGATTVDVPTDGITTLSPGKHTFTAEQEFLLDPVPAPLDGDSPVNVIGPVSTALAPVIIDTTLPAFSPDVPAVISAYTFTIHATEDNGLSNFPALVYSLVTAPATMSINQNTGFITWLRKPSEPFSQPVEVRVADVAGNSTTANFTVDVTGVTQPVNLPTGTGNQFTVRQVVNPSGYAKGAYVQVSDDKTHAALLTQLVTTAVPIDIVYADNVADTVTIDFAVGGAFTLPLGLLVTGGASPAQNILIVRGTAGSTFNLQGGTITADGLATTFANVGMLELVGGGGNNTYKFSTSNTNVAVLTPSAADTLDFSGVTGGVGIGTAAKPFNLALETAQLQTIAPWGNHWLALIGSIANLTGTNYNDFLMGNAANNIIRGGGGSNIIYGGGGNDVLIASSGATPTNSRVYAGSGNCLLIAGTQAASLYGGPGNDILVGGSTSYDTDTAANDAALSAILKGGSALGFFGNPLAKRMGASAPAGLYMGTSVHSGGADLLFGGGGRDWFLAGANCKYWL